MEQLTSAELAEWEAYDKLEPVDRELRADLRNASLCALITNTVRQLYGKKGTKMASPEDFMPKWGEEPEAPPQKQSVEDMKKILYAIASAANSKGGNTHG